MEWIEQIFGISPDGGSGVTEALIFAVLLLMVAGYPLGEYGVKRLKRFKAN
jgi:hypothetical protein